MFSVLIFMQVVLIGMLTISSYHPSNAFPSWNGIDLIKRDSQCCACKNCNMDDTKAFQLSRSSWKENVFSTFKADSGVVEVTFTFSKGGGVESAPFMEIKNYDKYDYEVFVNAKKIFIYGDDDGSATTTKNFTVKAKGDCKAELLPGASVSSITEVNAQKKEKKQ